MAAWLGLVPRQRSSGNRRILLAINTCSSRQGPSVRCQFGQRTLAGTYGNERNAPTEAIRGTGPFAGPGHSRDRGDETFKMLDWVPSPSLPWLPAR
jgi:hypothetical protein